MQASWRQELTDDQLLVWADTLADLPFEPARQAVRTLRKTIDYLPTHHQLIDATKREARIGALSTRSADVRPPCSRCDGTGWAWVAVAGGVDAVTRCRCTAGGPRDANHPGGCTCRACHYGADQAAAIAAGVDGFSRGGGAG